MPRLTLIQRRGEDDALLPNLLFSIRLFIQMECHRGGLLDVLYLYKYAVGEAIIHVRLSFLFTTLESGTVVA